MTDTVLPRAPALSKRKRGDSPRKTGRVKRHIAEYSNVIEGYVSGFPSKSL